METNNQKNDQNIIPNDADKQQKGVNVPNLRFKNIGADNFPNWTISDIGKECDFFNGVAHENDVVERGQYIIVNSKFVSSNGKIKKYTNTLGFELKCNDIVMVMSDVPNGKAIAKCYLIDQNNKYTLNQRICCLRTEHNSVFILNQINRNAYFLKFDDGVKQTNLRKEDILNCPLYICCKKEQEKIANFLSLIDKRIDTQSKIIEDLQTLKISICDKVFEDTTYPEYKLKDVLSERIEKSNVNNQYEILSSTIKGLFTQKEYFDKDIASSNNIGYKIVHLYDIIISPQNLWMGNITFNQRFTNGLVSPSYKIYIINNNFDMYYIANMLKTKRAMYKYICSSQQGASVVRRNLNMDDFLSLSFNIPDIIKQRKIGLLLNTIDKRIDLEQTYLTKLNQQKKFLLKNMFI